MRRSPLGKYHQEHSAELSRDVYFIPSHEINSQQLQVSLGQILADKENYSYLYKFVLKIIDQHMWQHPEAQKKFVAFLDNVDKTQENKTQELYKQLNEYYIELEQEYGLATQLGMLRGENRAGTIQKHIFEYAERINQDVPEVANYLDVGCFDGSITKAIGTHFGLGRDQIVGLDVNSFEHLSEDEYKSINFVQYDGKKFPFEDEQFDLITCLMTLHHVNPDDLEAIVAEMRRVIKPGGVIILREHDVNLKDARKVISLNLMHDFYDYVWETTNANWVDYDEHQSKCETNEIKNNYKSSTQWGKMFHDAGFNDHIKPKVFKSFDKNPYMSYMCSYTI